MRVNQTSPTTFELTSDNGCVVMAGFSTATMASAGVYWHRVTLISKSMADQAFREDPRVQKAIAECTIRFGLPTDCPIVREAMAIAAVM